MHFFFQKDRTLSDSLLIMLKCTHFLGTYLITGDLRFRGKIKFAMKRQFIVRMCDFELKF